MAKKIKRRTEKKQSIVSRKIDEIKDAFKERSEERKAQKRAYNRAYNTEKTKALRQAARAKARQDVGGVGGFRQLDRSFSMDIGSDPYYSKSRRQTKRPARREFEQNEDFGLDNIPPLF